MRRARTPWMGVVEQHAFLTQQALEELRAVLDLKRPNISKVARGYRALQDQMRNIAEHDQEEVDQILSHKYNWSRVRRYRLQETYVQFYHFVRERDPRMVSQTNASDRQSTAYAPSELDTDPKREGVGSSATGCACEELGAFK